jgi:hypothetical protein
MVLPLPLVDLTEPIDERLTPREALAIVARVLQQAGAATTAVGGSLLFVIGPSAVGADDVETWRVELDPPGGHWSHSAMPADVMVVAAFDALPAIINAPDDVARLVNEGAIKVRGDKERLERLATLLAGAGNRISIRFPGGL